MNRSPLPLGWAALAALALAATAGSPSAARADNLDVALLKHAPEVMDYLRGQHCRNVGVLKFRVRKAGHQASFKTGPINDNIVERLENALIAVEPTDSPIGVVRDASGHAEARKLAKYDTPAGQKALFAIDYPMAWGDAKVRPDLMLTGVIEVAADLKSVTVRIEGFGPDSPKQDRVVTFPVATDRSLLTDLNESFKVAGRSLKRKTRAIELDEEAIADAADAAPDPNATATTTGLAGLKAKSQDLLYYEVRYDGQPQPIGPDPSNPGEFLVAEPREGQAVSFVIRSQATDRIGLVLMVDGKSTLYEETGDPAHCKAWVLDPGKTFGIEGFQMDNNTRKPFRVLSDQETAALTYGPNTGLIQFHIMQQGSKNDVVDPKRDDDPTAKAMNISLRGLPRSHAAKPRTLREVKAEIKAHAHVPGRIKTRGEIVGGDAVAGTIENDEVLNQVLVQSIAVRYYKPKAH